MIKYLFYGLIAALFFFGVYAVMGQSAKEVSEYKVSKVKLTEEVNKWTLANKGYEYKELPKLCDVAALRLNQIKRDFSHSGFLENNKAFYSIVKSVELGENLAEGTMDEKQILESWLKSPSHRTNLDHKYEYMCIQTDDNYTVQMFANL